MRQFTTAAVQDGIGTVRLNRPQSYNALNLPTAKELAGTLMDFASDRAVRAIIITGTGKAFSAGGDLKQVLAHPVSPAAAFHEIAAHVDVCIIEIRRVKKPVIAAINGVAAGGGFSLALACDFRVMGQSAWLKQSFTSNGLSVDGGATFALPRLVGLARALEIAAFDEPITAEQALNWGLVTQVVPDDRVLAEAEQMARTLAQKSLHSFGLAKELLTNSFDTPFETQLENERQGLVACANHPDGLEGMRAFVEKRKPRFNT
ncbi:MAG: enoyl-CoA hydratase/isomerase family protein [Chloroflexi bacterium]|nr:MAG: enoyl-CoA hydratase/isomerase family protein [Chloroflexota bacterium]